MKCLHVKHKGPMKPLRGYVIVEVVVYDVVASFIYGKNASSDLVYIQRLCVKLWLGVYTKIVCEVVTWCIYKDCVKLWLGVYTKIVCEVVTWCIHKDFAWSCDLVYVQRLCVKLWLGVYTKIVCEKVNRKWKSLSLYRSSVKCQKR